MYSDANAENQITSWTPDNLIGNRTFAGVFASSGGSGRQYINADGTFTANLLGFRPTSATTLYANNTLNTYSCSAGQYLKCTVDLSCTCETCPGGKYCAGGTFSAPTANGAVNMGITGTLSAGYYSTGGAKSATPTSSDCTSGYSCGPVAAGYYSTGGATSSTGDGAVAAGYYSTGGGTSATPTSSDCVSGYSCGPVAADYYSQGGAKVSNPSARADCTSSSCGAVSGGYYSTGGGTSATPTAADNGCLAGYECGIVAAGYYSTYGATSSSGSGIVAAGYYSTGGAKSATPTSSGCISGNTCGPVAAGYYSTGGGKSATGDCVSGNTCGSVSGGYYSTGGGKSQTPTSSDCTSGNTCGAVGAGYYSTGGGTSETPTTAGNGCLAGYKCGTVTAGYYSTGGGKTASNSCLSSYKCGTVAAGYYSTGGGKSVTPTSSDCTSGKSCGTVAAGYYSTSGGTSATPTAAGNGCVSGKSCGTVAAGYYSTGGGTAAQPTTTGKGCLAGYECGLVAAGYYSSGGGTSVTPVEPGNGCVAGKSCGQCNPGEYSSSGASACYYCSGGTWSDAGASACLTCPAGTYSNARSGSTICLPCDAGTTSVAGVAPSQTACSACSNASNVSSWLTPGWTAETNSATNICQINACSTKYILSDNACTACTLTPNSNVSSATVESSSNTQCIYSYICKTGYHVNGTTDGTTNGYTTGAEGSAQNSVGDCVANPYTVQYDANGGTGTTASQNLKYGIRFSPHGSRFTYAGRKFLGWAMSPQATTPEYIPGQTYYDGLTTEYSGTVILYAVWEAMVVNGPQNNSKVYDGTPLTCNGGLSVTSPSGAEIKYATSQNGTYSTTAPTITNVAESKTIYYQISATDYTPLTGSFKCTIAKAPNPITLSAYAVHVPYGRTITVSVVDAQGELSVSNTSVATVKLSGTIVEMTGGSSYGIATITVTAAGNDNYLVGSKSFTLNVDRGLVTLDPGAGTGGTPRIYHQYNTNVWLDAFEGHEMRPSTIPITIPTRNGYTFVGYYADENSTTALIGENGYITPDGFAAATAAKSNITWVARWMACPYAVVFDANGGSGSMTSQNFAIDNAQNLKANTFTRGGYKFLGWATTKNATTAEYTNGQSVKNLVTTCDVDDVTLYAVWTPNTITINYDSNGGTSVASTTCEYDSTFVLAAAPANSGKQFSYWSVNGGTYNSGATIDCNYATLGVYSGAATIKANWGTCPAGSYCPTDGAPQACPPNYPNSTDGATSSSDCYLITTAGNYVATKNAAEVTCKSGGYYCEGGWRIFYGLTGGFSECDDLPGIEVANGTYSTSPSTGASASSACRYVAPSTTVTGCSTVTRNTVSYTGSKWNSNYYTVTAAKGYHVGDNNVANPTCVVCGADKYQTSNNSTATSCTPCLTNYHTYGNTAADHDAASDCQISCDGGSYLAKANDTTCTNVGAGYWAANSMVNYGSAGSRTPCKNGWTTIGYGFGANEEDDCGRIFNYGNQKIYLRSAKRGDASQPALHVKIGDVIFYGTMKQVSGPQSGFNAEYDGKNYLITNDDQ